MKSNVTMAFLIKLEKAIENKKKEECDFHCVGCGWYKQCVELKG